MLWPATPLPLPHAGGCSRGAGLAPSTRSYKRSRSRHVFRDQQDSRPLVSASGREPQSSARPSSLFETKVFKARRDI